MKEETTNTPSDIPFSHRDELLKQRLLDLKEFHDRFLKNKINAYEWKRIANQGSDELLITRHQAYREGYAKGWLDALDMYHHDHIRDALKLVYETHLRLSTNQSEHLRRPEIMNRIKEALTIDSREPTTASLLQTQRNAVRAENRVLKRLLNHSVETIILIIQKHRLQLEGDMRWAKYYRSKLESGTAFTDEDEDEKLS